MSVADVFHEAFGAILEGKFGRMLSSPRNIYTWLTHDILDPTHSGRVAMHYLMKLVTTALEWSYLAGETDVKVEMLEKAASLLVLRRNTLWIIDGEGPSIEMPRSDTTEQKNLQEATAGEAQAEEHLNEPPPHHDEVAETQKAAPSTNCSFSGRIELEVASFLESTVEVVQCPTCGSVSKAKVKGQSVVISSHPPRKSRPVRNVTRWMQQGIEWVLVQKKA